MSFEGYYQQLCKLGHYTTNNIHGCTDVDENCYVCGKAIVWTNLVDETNGSFDDNGNRIDGYIALELLDIAKCAKCGHADYTSETYKIPNKRKRKK